MTTTTKIEAAGYVIVDNEGIAIFGYGETEQAAWAMATADADPEIPFDEDGYDAEPASADLLANVRDFGTPYSWSSHNGVACTNEEFWAQ